MSNLYTIRASPGAGLGLFTTRPISPGTVLETSKPLLKLPRNKHDTSPTALQTAFSLVPPAKQQTLLALHDNPALPYPDRIMRIYKSNCFGDEAYAWMWLDFARCNHSCLPNAEIAEVEDQMEGAKLVAIRELGAGEEVRISYLGPLEDGPGTVRRRFLRETYGFECACATCCLEGEERRVSDLRRGLIHVLSRWQMGFEVGALRMLGDVSGVQGGGKVLGGSKRRLKTPRTAREKVVGNWLLARLLTAEGLVGYRVAQAWMMAAVALMSQMQDAKPLVVMPAARLLLEWLDEAVRAMKAVQRPESRDVVELEQACGVMRRNSYVQLARRVMEREGQEGKTFAVAFGEPGRCLSQAECLHEMRKMRGCRMEEGG